eukprot:COSAG04_NODE_31154_length_258_cov_0.886792_2_plen_30_part_01
MKYTEVPYIGVDSTKHNTEMNAKSRLRVSA